MTDNKDEVTKLISFQYADKLVEIGKLPLNGENKPHYVVYFYDHREKCIAIHGSLGFMVSNYFLSTLNDSLESHGNYHLTLCGYLPEYVIHDMEKMTGLLNELGDIIEKFNK